MLIFRNQLSIHGFNMILQIIIWLLIAAYLMYKTDPTFKKWFDKAIGNK